MRRRVLILQLAANIALGALALRLIRRRERAGQGDERAWHATLNILRATLPYLRTGLSQESAQKTARMVYEQMGVSAVSIVDRERILAFVGAGSDHHKAGHPYMTQLTRQVLRTGRPGVVNTREGIRCPVESCPLASAVVVPLKVRAKTVGCLKLYQTRPGDLGGQSREVAMALAQLFGTQLELAELEAQAARVTEAELKALRAQISPHFLFNTLNTIASVIRTNPEMARGMIVDFAHFFRETLKKHGESCTLAEELDYVEKYVSFQKARLGERLSVEYCIAPETLDTILPVLVIQPLVENAVNHGIQSKVSGGTIVISSRREDGVDVISVTDNGVGIPQERLVQVLQPGYGTGLGMGLSNVNERLKSLFGPEHALAIESSESAGTTATVTIPRMI